MELKINNKNNRKYEIKIIWNSTKKLKLSYLAKLYYLVFRKIYFKIKY